MMCHSLVLRSDMQTSALLGKPLSECLRSWKKLSKPTNLSPPALPTNYSACRFRLGHQIPLQTAQIQKPRGIDPMV